jgi:hypothetical protein
MDQLLGLELVGFRGLGHISRRIMCLDALNCNTKPNAINCRQKTY